jgi:hypothetical protein
VRAWSRNLWSAWYRAHLATADELQWLATITAVSKTRKGRQSSAEDAARLDTLQDALACRERDAEQANRRKVVTGLHELGLPVPKRVVWWLRED